MRTLSLLLILAVMAAGSSTNAKPPANEPAFDAAAESRPASRRATRAEVLIGQLGSEEFAKREAAEKELVAIGLEAVETLRRSSSATDPEVAQRAASALAKIEETAERKNAECRAAIKSWLGTDQEKQAGGMYLQLLAFRPRVADWRGATKYFEEHKDWPKLARAYELTAARMWEIVSAPPETFVRAMPQEAGGGGAENLEGRGGPSCQVQMELDGEWTSNAMGQPANWMDRIKRNQTAMRQERISILGKLGQLCLAQVNDPKRAVAAYEAAARGIPLCEEKLEGLIPQMWPKMTVKAAAVAAYDLASPGGVRVPILNGLSEARVAAGDLRGAAEARLRAMLATLIDVKGDWNASGPAQETDAFWQIVRRMPAGESLPPMLWLKVLDRQGPAFDMKSTEDEPHGLPYSFPGPQVVIRPGQTAKTITVSADMETENGGGGVRCISMVDGKVVDIGSVRWYADGRSGREWRTATFDLPENVGIIRMEITPTHGVNFHVRELKVSADFGGAAGSSIKTQEPGVDKPATAATPATQSVNQVSAEIVADSAVGRVQAAKVSPVDVEQIRMEVPAGEIGGKYVIIGQLGRRLGTYVNFEGTPHADPVMMASPFDVDTVDGKKLDKPVLITLEGVKDLPKGVRRVFRGYETGAMVSSPMDATVKDAPLPQVSYHFATWLVVTAETKPAK